MLTSGLTSALSSDVALFVLGAALAIAGGVVTERRREKRAARAACVMVEREIAIHRAVLRPVASQLRARQSASGAVVGQAFHEPLSAVAWHEVSPILAAALTGPQYRALTDWYAFAARIERDQGISTEALGDDMWTSIISHQIVAEKANQLSRPWFLSWLAPIENAKASITRWLAQRRLKGDE